MPVNVDASGKACKGWAGNLLNWSRFLWNEYGPRGGGGKPPALIRLRLRRR